VTRQNQRPALRACPSCGSSEAKGLHVRRGMIAVECTRCGYRGGEVDAAMGLREAQDAAVRRWNRSAVVTPA
jgi:Zn ribbon nucleic-acid-binding protein